MVVVPCVKGKENKRKMAEMRLKGKRRKIARGLIVALRNMDLILVIVVVGVEGNFMIFKKINICVFKKTLCGQQLEARIAVKSLWKYVHSILYSFKCV